MSYSDLALIAFVTVIVVVIVDWRRGVTGLGRLRLTKEESPEKFWMAIALYLNMAFGLFWLAGNTTRPEPACNPSDGDCVSVTLEASS